MLTNDFTEETRELFFWNKECWICKGNNPDAMHHILGRVSASPLNCCPIHNFKCHIGNGKLATFDMKKILLEKTLNYLLENNYHLTSEDKKFMKKFKKYYEKNC